jgi:hypothetical protein
MTSHPSKRAVRGPLRWLFENRRTGKITVVQLPNLPLAVFLTVAAIRAVVHLHGLPATVIGAVASVALVWWAVGEIARGVNPFRRALGACVLAVAVVGLFRG